MDVHSSVNVCYKVLHTAKWTSLNINQTHRKKKRITEFALPWLTISSHFKLCYFIVSLEISISVFFSIISKTKTSFSGTLSILAHEESHYKLQTSHEGVGVCVYIYIFKKNILLATGTGIVMLGAEEWNYIRKIWQCITDFQAVYFDAKCCKILYSKTSQK